MYLDYLKAFDIVPVMRLVKKQDLQPVTRGRPHLWIENYIRER